MRGFCHQMGAPSHAGSFKGNSLSAEGWSATDGTTLKCKTDHSSWKNCNEAPTLLDGRIDRIEGFATEGEAGRWIKTEATVWLHNRSRKGEGGA